MDIKCPQNTLGTFMEYIVLWQIVFGTSKAKCLFCHHPQDPKKKIRAYSFVANRIWYIKGKMFILPPPTRPKNKIRASRTKEC
jgi:hypothetical protein